VTVAAATTALETIGGLVAHLTRTPTQRSDTSTTTHSRLRDAYDALARELEAACVQQLGQTLCHKRSCVSAFEAESNAEGNAEEAGVDALTVEPLPVEPPQPPRRHVKWSDEDTKTLCNMHERGDSWDAISKVCSIPHRHRLYTNTTKALPGRTVPALKRRYYDVEPKNNDAHPKKRKPNKDEAPSINEEQVRESLPLLPLEQQGTVPCPNATRGCTRVFATYALAVTHDVNMCSQRQTVGPFPCPWKCGDSVTSRRSLVAHYPKHTGMQKGNHYACRRGCNTHWPNAYLLTIHEDMCGTSEDPSTTAKRRSRILKINLGPGTGKPSILIVARCSNSAPPNAWYAGKETLEEGLPIWVQPALESYRRLYQDYRHAEIHAGVHVQTAFAPAPRLLHDLVDSADWTSTNKGLVSNKIRSHTFTSQIETALQVAPDRPVILSTGADGFSCNTGRIEAFIHRVRPFDLVVRFHAIAYNDNGPTLTEGLLTRHDMFWWHVYASEDLARVPRQGSTDLTLLAVRELKTWWADLQRRKDTQSANFLKPGRNN
jgi:hypothetical protein